LAYIEDITKEKCL